MCGILTILDIEPSRANLAELRRHALAMGTRLRHRGPDWSGIWSCDRAILVHERLSIVDVEHGAQPLVDAQNGNVLAVNGEIYNHKELRGATPPAPRVPDGSDCEVMLYLYDESSPRTS